LLNLGGLASGPEIGELLFCLPELPLGLFEGRQAGDVVLVKQRRSAGDFGASLDENGRQEARERRADLHESASA
jgi:hypothetical protein